ncbi:uncharacterized protein At1g01500-like [Salvia miltiorrhiza]|uniref:uncharacterized protein At1g01500-like n=1 Tax=Salvia miltiorrhiza TaxID=226208 RepID=UPI0025ACBECD|nr:uncharacterized protein At1g01500-like [Salvia miltiorrhiza]XP_057788372.1 uncharacterized protein At1g01500-like [Salvia miltiorrhiza]XP_057788373.1 uncharacterized protein At1g01500-like [Salvia miltiorrhiza]XP_057788374.1 uncharacterized protein At1g01500-like [Salvia miltiorrhiza]
MDANEEEVLISLRGMGDTDEVLLHENGVAENGHHAVTRHPSYQPSSVKASLQWLDLRVFYVRVSKCVVDDDSTPEYLTLNHVPLNRDTLLEVNCVRTSIYSDGVSTLLKRDRLDKQSEEVTFVSTDSIRMTGSVKFEVFRENVLVLTGRLELCHSNGSLGEHRHPGQIWSMSCESDLIAGTGFLKGNQNACAPAIEVYVAGSFSGSPIILTQTLQLSHHRRKQTRKAMLEAIPEYETTLSQKEGPSTLTMPLRNYEEYRQEEGHSNAYYGMEYLEGEDGELSWFNAGVRVGVGIGLGICLGVGVGVGLLVRTYQGTTRNFTRRLL